ncbi:DMSO/TMAO reductase YedYZ molybdopterin-dependent catalytic subunit [Paenibacillus rhizosphaerae]|uniref:DMSO/TMAO reductase YedYZ molybdopterin-dependent catalytic subunit n=1 Tax=Paenibacillus rhizosphaerae TaxID=297318 RepID=A0A839TNK5_9BACL|nr:sulfite oxidase-like oxidoreductase [Paenibacillus rhizosphaerae]MBB3128494.1 DMSO/TMAO reductase YedYZ molybdopterin-dependent catalytic subunit [Paenibacillus rhizosphaerae]
MHNKAERLKKMKPVPVGNLSEEQLAKLPPGQSLTDKFPILHEGDVPHYNMEEWTLQITGEVEEPRTFTYKELLAIPTVAVNCDIHCVTRWSKFDTTWEGILFRDFLKLLKVKPEAKYVMFHADPDYDTNVPIEDLLRDDVLLAYRFNGEPLTEKHGWPLRTVVPHRYFWKSAKWLRKIEFMKEDRPGFWERNGFHNEADPFKEERFSGEALPIPEDEWTHKEYD